MQEKAVVLNNPIRDGILRIALYNENNGIIHVSLYNISGELVMKIDDNVDGGFTILQKKISKAPGIYLLRIVIKTDKRTISLPIKKIGIIK
jgi:hypothetical protein